jgi:membrane-anchored protein YejM (alkaline phosphatase superfamily)
MALRDNFPQNVVSPLVQMGRQAIAPEKAGRDLCTYDVQHRYQTHIDLEQHAIQLLQGDQADFIFLHLAVPHSPNIWSRANDDYTQSCDGSYLDSLALADREMGKILGMLQSSPRWKDTTLIVQGDHGWRIDLWNWTSVWTEEDEAVSRGVFDPRAALLIHQAGQTQPGTNSTAWPLLRVHDVVEQVLHGQQVSY